MWKSLKWGEGKWRRKHYLRVTLWLLILFTLKASFQIMYTVHCLIFRIAKFFPFGKCVVQHTGHVDNSH